MNQTCSRLWCARQFVCIARTLSSQCAAETRGRALLANVNHTAMTRTAVAPFQYLSRRPYASEAALAAQDEEEAYTLDEKNAQPESIDNYRICPETKKLMIHYGMTKLFPIQAACFNHLFDGKNVIARARTGTGKTLSFALPMIELFKKDRNSNPGRRPRGLIIAPTRELAIQVWAEIKKLAPELSGVCVYGGTPYATQEGAMRQGLDIVVGTPGRLADHIEKGNLHLEEVKYVVLDEADRMLDQGFQEELDKILSVVQKSSAKHQVALFSATLPSWVRNASRRYLGTERVMVDLVGSETVKTSELVTHKAISCVPRSQNQVAQDLVKLHGVGNRSIIFVETKTEASRVSNAINNSAELHGDISQTLRESTLRAFRRGEIMCLVATDVAARGLDIPEVALVIQMEPPRDFESYIHRSGRTGRAGKSGTCITLYTPQQQNMLVQIEQHIGLRMQQIPAPSPIDILEVTCKDIVGQFAEIDKKVAEQFRAIAEQTIATYGPVEALCLTLATVTGATKTQQRSLLSRAEGFQTVEIRTRQLAHNPTFIWSMIERAAPALKEDCKNMTLLATKNGAVLDVATAKLSRFLTLMASTDATVSVCTTLPPLQERAGSGGGFRGSRFTPRGGSGGGGFGGSRFTPRDGSGGGGFGGSRFTPRGGSGGGDNDRFNSRMGLARATRGYERHDNAMHSPRHL